MIRRWVALVLGIALLAGCGKLWDSSKKVVAEVNGERITLKELEQELNNLLPQQKSAYKGDRVGFLEELITREVLLQEARREGIEGVSPDVLIQKLVESTMAEVEVTEEEVKDLYNEHKAQLRGRTFEEAKDRLESIVRQQKGQKFLGGWIEELKSKAQIKRNDKWIRKERAKGDGNPLDRALKTGRPVLADFGRGTCIPCKRMKPILEELKQEYRGKAEILIIQIDDYRALTRRERIRLIPTQIFFDKDGKELYRHEGFMDREAIRRRLEELGVRGQG